MEITREQKALAAQVVLPMTPLPSTPDRCPAWVETLGTECRFRATEGLLCHLHHLVAEQKLAKLRKRRIIKVTTRDDIRPGDHVTWTATWKDGSVKRTEIREGIAHHRDIHGDWLTEEGNWLTWGEEEGVTITVRHPTLNGGDRED